MGHGFLDFSDEKPARFCYGKCIAVPIEELNSNLTFQSVYMTGQHRRMDAKCFCCFMEAARLGGEQKELLGSERDIN